MTIAIVQSSTPTEVDSGLSATTTFSSNPTAGNAIVIVSAHYDTGNTFGTVSFSDGVNSYTVDLTDSHPYLLINTGSTFGIAAHGSPLTITATYSSGSSGNMRWMLAAFELSGLGGFDQAATNLGNTTTTPSSGSTGTLANANSFVLAAVTASSSLAGATVPPTGGPGTYTSIISDLTGSDFQYAELARQLILSNNSAVSASWGTISTTAYWLAAVSVYKAAGGGGSGGNQPLTLLNVAKLLSRPVQRHRSPQPFKRAA